MPWKLEDDFDATARALEEGARRASRSTAEKVKAQAQKNAPVKSGKLRDSARVVETEAGAEVVFDAPYAAQVNDGHMNDQGKFVGARPFFTNAINTGSETLDQEGEALLRELGADV